MRCIRLKSQCLITKSTVNMCIMLRIWLKTRMSEIRRPQIWLRQSESSKSSPLSRFNYPTLRGWVNKRSRKAKCFCTLSYIILAISRMRRLGFHLMPAETDLEVISQRKFKTQNLHPASSSISRLCSVLRDRFLMLLPLKVVLDSIAKLRANEADLSTQEIFPFPYKDKLIRTEMIWIRVNYRILHWT
jgi:hypothetical protein